MSLMIKACEPLTDEQHTVMRLLLSYASMENINPYELLCREGRDLNLMTLYRQNQLLGCIVLDPHKQDLVACCLLKDTANMNEGLWMALKNKLDNRYPKHKVSLRMETCRV